MLLNRTLKKDKFFQQTSQTNYISTGSTNFRTKTSTTPLNELTEYQLQLLSYKQSLTKDINHPRIRELIMNQERIQTLLTNKSAASQSKENLKNNLINLQLLEQRKWLTKKGKKYLIDFDDNERKQMKDCFNAMDVKNTGSIGIDQLQELLVSVGLMESREQVKQLIDSVDQDKSGKIQFSEFLKMILNDEGENQEIVQFFKFIINSKRTKNQQQIEWSKKSKSKSRSKSKDFQLSPSKQKMSLIHDKQNMPFNCSYEKSSFHQNRNKFYSSPQNTKTPQVTKKNSALNIFQKHPHPKNLPFGMIVSHIRRKHMMTALKVNQHDPPALKKTNSSNYSHDENRSNHFISNSVLRSSQNIKESKASINNKSLCLEEEVVKGQCVMNALRKMWDRRLLRQIKDRKSKKLLDSKITPLTDKGAQSKKFLPNLV